MYLFSCHRCVFVCLWISFPYVQDPIDSTTLARYQAGPQDGPAHIGRVQRPPPSSVNGTSAPSSASAIPIVSMRLHVHILVLSLRFYVLMGPFPSCTSRAQMTQPHPLGTKQVCPLALHRWTKFGSRNRHRQKTRRLRPHQPLRRP